MTQTANGLDFDLLRVVALNALKLAKGYFDIPEEIETRVYFEQHPELSENGSALICIEHGYLFASIHIAPDRARSYEGVWRSCGHEIAHLVSREWNIESMMDEDELKRARLTICCEQTTTRLERMFARDCPYPGAEVFEKETRQLRRREAREHGHSLTPTGR